MHQAVLAILHGLFYLKEGYIITPRKASQLIAESELEITFSGSRIWTPKLYSTSCSHSLELRGNKAIKQGTYFLLFLNTNPKI